MRRVVPIFFTTVSVLFSCEDLVKVLFCERTEYMWIIWIRKSEKFSQKFTVVVDIELDKIGQGEI